MSSVPPPFEADFFNNVAAIAVVLMFTKVVSHHIRKVKRGTKWRRRLAVIHTVAVAAALIAATISLIATHCQPGGVGYHIAAWAAWVFLGIAGIILLGDHVVDELAHAFCQTASADSAAKPGETHTDSP